MPATDVRTEVVTVMIAPTPATPATSDKKSDRGGGAAGSSLDSLRSG